MSRSSGYGTITSTGTLVIAANDVVFEKLISVNPGTTYALSIYDASTAATATAARLIQTHTMAANDNIEYVIPCQYGITVISTGTAGTAIVTWSRA